MSFKNKCFLYSSLIFRSDTFQNKTKMQGLTFVTLCICGKFKLFYYYFGKKNCIFWTKVTKIFEADKTFVRYIFSNIKICKNKYAWAWACKNIIIIQICSRIHRIKSFSTSNGYVIGRPAPERFPLSLSFTALPGVFTMFRRVDSCTWKALADSVCPYPEAYWVLPSHLVFCTLWPSLAVWGSKPSVSYTITIHKSQFV